MGRNADKQRMHRDMSTDKYVFLPEDPRAESYFQGLSLELQNKIRAMDKYPATFQGLMDAVDRAREGLF